MTTQLYILGAGTPTPTPNASGWFKIKVSEFYAKYYHHTDGDAPGTGNPSGTN